jgi:hypothetical protein
MGGSCGGGGGGGTFLFKNTVSVSSMIAQLAAAAVPASTIHPPLSTRSLHQVKTEELPAVIIMLLFASRNIRQFCSLLSCWLVVVAGYGGTNGNSNT